jgi:hypothetical protein
VLDDQIAGQVLAHAMQAAAEVHAYPRRLARHQADGIIGAPIVGIGQVLVGQKYWMPCVTSTPAM